MAYSSESCERGQRGGDDVRVRAGGDPGAGLVPGLDDHPRARARWPLAVEDADLVVDEVHVVERGVERAQRLAQRQVERVDRPVAVGRGVEHLAVDLDLDLASARAAAPLRRSTITVKSTIRNGAT